MSKAIAIIICVAIFIIGLSLGLFFSKPKEEPTVPDTAELTRQIQDIVISQVQANQKEKYEVEEVATEAIQKISPYAKIIVEKYYKQCGHTTVDIIDVPIELINYTEDEFKKKYDKWEIKSFSSKEISIYREIDANCSSHYVIKEDDGYLAVYSEITEDLLELKEKTDIELTSLRDEDKVALTEGIRIYRN